MIATSIMQLGIAAVLAVSSAIGFQAGVFRPVPQSISTLDDWSFDTFPIPQLEELTNEELQREQSMLDVASSEDYCEADVLARFDTYLAHYPRYRQFAGDQRALQKFLYHLVLRSDHSTTMCYPSYLVQRVFDHGKNRCNLNINVKKNHPVLQRDLDKVIELVEYRHSLLVYTLLNHAPVHDSSWLLWDTNYYLLMIDAVDTDQLDGLEEIYETSRDIVLSQLPDQDPKRVQFIADAAKRNDFRSVLATNSRCLIDQSSMVSDEGFQ